MNKPDGGPAFPSASIESVFVEEIGRYDDRLGPPQGGMSLRDYFAAAAVGGWLADSRCSLSLDAIVERSYEVADLMLAERAK